MAVSEFGRGYVTCLFQFANHAKRLNEYVDTYVKLMAPKYPDLFDEERAVEIWANGASDHLYELLHPPRIIPKRQAKEAFAIAAQALDAGHGFRGRRYTLEQAQGWLDITCRLIAEVEVRTGRRIDSLDAAMDVDRILGLRPDRGTWACKEDLAKWP